MKKLLVDFRDGFLCILLFIFVWSSIGFLIGAGYAAGEKLVNGGFNNDVEFAPIIQPIKIDTITQVQIEYRDTSDSQFMRAIIENERRGYSKLMNGEPIYPKTGDGGKAIGLFQMHESYFNCKLSEALEYKYEDMLRPDKSFHIFWAKMGIYADWYYRQYGEVPTFEQLARMHNGSRHGHNRDSTLPYKKKYLSNFYRRLKLKKANDKLRNKLR